MEFKVEISYSKLKEATYNQLDAEILLQLNIENLYYEFKDLLLDQFAFLELTYGQYLEQIEKQKEITLDHFSNVDRYIAALHHKISFQQYLEFTFSEVQEIRDAISTGLIKINNKNFSFKINEDMIFLGNKIMPISIMSKASEAFNFKNSQIKPYLQYSVDKDAVLSYLLKECQYE